LMSLDYVPNTIAYKHLHRLGVYTQLTCTPSQIGSIHSTHMDLHRLGVYTQPTCPLHRLGVYTQPICPFTDWEYTLNPHALWIGTLGVYTQPTCPLCNLQEEMEKTHLIRCPTGENEEDPPDLVSSTKDNDGNPEILGSKKKPEILGSKTTAK
uniref:Tax protein n=1 Tax=Rodentolepis nana TaxID=102285 RepID=A0A0R3T8M9_RODNA